MRTLVTYALLVGGPLLGLLLILRWGAALEPPPDLAGHWRVNEVDVVVRIEQSGRYLRAHSGGDRFDVMLEEGDGGLLELHVDRGRCAGWRGALEREETGWVVRVIEQGCLSDDQRGRMLTLARTHD